jgi:hypothetical protein
MQMSVNWVKRFTSNIYKFSVRILMDPIEN